MGRIFKITVASLAALSLTAACVTDPETGKKTISKTAIGGVGGAVAGYFLGDLIGGKRDRTAKIAGAGIGAVAGAGVGYYLDQQAREMRERTAGSGVEVTREGDALLVNMPSGITFDVNSSTVKTSFQSTLDQVAGTLVQYEKTYIDVYGHTDSTGADTYNQTLSERRAASVASYLTSKGVQVVRVATRGYGESQPIATNATEDGRQANRRVELKIVPVTEADVAATTPAAGGL